MADDLDDWHAALEAEAADWVREEVETDELTPTNMWRLEALLIRARESGLSNSEIAEMINRAVAKAEGAEPLSLTDQDVATWLSDLDARDEPEWDAASLLSQYE